MAGNYPQPPPFQYPVSQQQKTNPPKQKGFFQKLTDEANAMGKTLSREVDWATGKINQFVDPKTVSQLMSNFQTGNTIQLISRTTGASLQVVSMPNGQLFLDGKGPLGGAFNAVWTVVNEGGNQVRLHNNNNFLTIVNGMTTLIHMPPGTIHGIETKLHLGQKENYVTIESVKEPSCHVGILLGGNLKPAKKTCKGPEEQFSVQLIFSPYAEPVLSCK